MIPLVLACARTCEGVGCEDEFDAAFLGLILGASGVVTRELSPLDADVLVAGDEDQGPHWDALLRPGHLIVGSPGDDWVRDYPTDGDPGLTPDNAIGSLQGTAGTAFGAQVRPLVDIDGNGVDELLVGAPLYSKANSLGEGAVYLFADGTIEAEAQPVAIIEGVTPGGSLGEVVEGCGDIDGDGLADFVAGAPMGGTDLEGEVLYVPGGELEPVRLVGPNPGASLGRALDCDHDADGDGLADLWLGAPFADGIRDAEGAALLLTGIPVDGEAEGQASLVLRGGQKEAWLGWSLQTGHADGDAVADLAVGAPGASASTPSPGEVLVWKGTSIAAQQTTHDFRLVGSEDGDSFGYDVAFGDLTGSGYDDLLVGAPRHNPDTANRGRAFQAGVLYVYRGTQGFSSFRGNMTVIDADFAVVEQRQFLRTGSVIRVGDTNDDQREDLVLVHQLDPSKPLF